jgi:iron(III) transport system substrate-binding protein
VDPATLSTYEDLADPAWKGRICIRSSDNIYNQSLVASMIEVYGVEKTEDWARGIVANMARPPQGGDRDQIKAVAAGQCDIAIANTYYLAGMLASDSPAEKVPAEKVRVFWPNQADRGVHVNVSGAVLVRDAKHADNARKLIEYLTGAKAQSWYAEVNGEYPVIADGSISDVLRDFGTFRADSLNLDKLGEHNAEAVRLMDRAGWK